MSSFDRDDVISNHTIMCVLCRRYSSVRSELRHCSGVPTLGSSQTRLVASFQIFYLNPSLIHVINVLFISDIDDQNDDEDDNVDITSDGNNLQCCGSLGHG